MRVLGSPVTGRAAFSADNGIGDLPGVHGKFEHVARMTVDAVSLPSFFPSPFAHGGYDIGDCMDVNSRCGTLTNLDAVVEKAQDLDLLVMINQIFNHISVEALWLKLSVAGHPDCDDYYVCADPKPDDTAST
ncbi:Trehalose-6-phosphate hydrolase [Jannaschia seosinensis]|uniref:Trehalose-6-phosphate hydrolase n=1 Tax=Jannaschia seosinensis TaxID=313367 RepID=A0A0M7BAS3_9RHOB|nr:Trehalose-6-phosphate hydrolase [Jannaschia seosinensis]